MKTLQIIKEEYAKSVGYDNWRDLIMSYVMGGTYNMSSHYEDLLIIVQQEQQKVIAEIEDIYTEDTDEFGDTIVVIGTQKQSIINEKNIIR